MVFLRPHQAGSHVGGDFAFGGNVLFATSFFVVQRTSRASLFGGAALANFIFWGYQIFILLAASGYVLGITQGKE